MVFTEIKEKKGRKYYYRVKSIRKGKKVIKDRIYLGANLSQKELKEKETKADIELYLLKNILTKEEANFLDKIKKKYSKEPKASFENRYESFCAFFTYNTNAIEGNTLTLRETADLLFENITPRKSLREINEILNHKKAFDYILNYKGDITKKFILDLHKLVVKDTLKPELESQIGRLRNIQVYIRGAEWIPPKPSEVPKEIKSLLSWYSKNKKKLHPLVVAVYFHIGFEIIHPFIDGNGRVGRLLMNFILHKNGYPMINIPNLIKYKYYNALKEAQINGDLKPFLKLLLNVLEESKVLF